MSYVKIGNHTVVFFTHYVNCGSHYVLFCLYYIKIYKMLYLNITRIATLRGIGNTTQFLIQNGFSRSIANRILKRADSYIKFSHIEKICLLLHCTPNDLLQWRPDAKMPVQPNEPLNALIHPQAQDLLNFLQNADINKLSLAFKEENKQQ